MRPYAAIWGHMGPYAAICCRRCTPFGTSIFFARGCLATQNLRNWNWGPLGTLLTFLGMLAFYTHLMEQDMQTATGTTDEPKQMVIPPKMALASTFSKS